MSATGRADVRRKDDAYYTPAWAVYRLLDEIGDTLPRPATWLEPCAGEGAIIDAVGRWYNSAKQPCPTWTVVELRPECLPVLKKRLTPYVTAKIHLGSFLDVPGVEGPGDLLRRERLALYDGARYPVAITNPPFSLAQEVIEHSFQHAQWVIMLLRSNYLASEGRSAFMRKYPPDLYQLPNRPSFTDDAKTDSTEYSWFVWPPTRHTRNEGRLKVLAPTPLEERR